MRKIKMIIPSFVYASFRPTLPALCFRTLFIILPREFAFVSDVVWFILPLEVIRFITMSEKDKCTQHMSRKKVENRL